MYVTGIRSQNLVQTPENIDQSGQGEKYLISSSHCDETTTRKLIISA